MSTQSITTLEELKDYLYKAMQLEHATIPPYLTALYSIKPGSNADAAQILRVIVVEEMLHLTIAANVLNAVGGAPDLTTPGFVANYPTPLPDGETDFEVGIQAFGLAALDTFLKIERPGMRAPHERAKHPVIQRHPARRKAVLASHATDSTLGFYSIGEFYAFIIDGIERLEAEARAKGGTIFTGDPARQITSEYYYSGGGHLAPVIDLASARAALDLVIEQGEGAGGMIYDDDAHELAHYYRFDELRQGRYYQKGDKPGHPTGPQLQVDWAGAYPIQPNLKLHQIPQGTELRATAAVFNARYAAFLALLTRAFNGEPNLLLTAVPMMFEFRNLMLALIRNPLPGQPGRNGGPTFEVDGHCSGASGAPHVEVAE